MQPQMQQAMQVHQAMMTNMMVLADVPKKKPADGKEEKPNLFVKTLNVIT